MIQPRLTDERDAYWERHEHDFRVILIKDDLHTAFDFDGSTLADVEEWAQQQEGVISIGIRSSNDLGQMGVLWLLDKMITEPRLG